MKSKTNQHQATSVAAFRKAVWKHYRTSGRHELAWRKTSDPYRILVSEMMLQQTQVARVVTKYREFLRAFPTVRHLASAPLSKVLKVWNGLGYNRRGKYLHDAAKIIVRDFNGNFDFALAEPLPGVGPYTRSAVRTFAYNEPHTMLETNIRAAYLHHFFPGTKKVNDRALVPYIEEASLGQDPREWHWALMDYGSYLKRVHRNPTRKSAHYVVQTKFEGSLRQVRGAILRILTTGAHGDLAISKKLSFDEKMVRDALSALARDGLVVGQRGSWRIA